MPWLAAGRQSGCGMDHCRSDRSLGQQGHSGQNFSCPAAAKCYDAIDAIECPAPPAKVDIFGALDAISKLPACAKLDQMCPPP